SDVVIVWMYFTVIISVPTAPTLFACTTLFRSDCRWALPQRRRRAHRYSHRYRASDPRRRSCRAQNQVDPSRSGTSYSLGWRDARSGEHTSELQSRENLVCRLLLENKKKERHAT